MSGFRFVHAADVHLDAPLTGLAGLEESVARRIRTATREAFAALVERTLEEKAAFLILAGDVFDDSDRDMRTAIFFADQMRRLASAGIRVFLLHGNHDAGSGITRHLPLPDNVRVFPANHVATFRIEELGVAVHGRSYPQREVREDLAAGYPDPVEDVFNVGVLHTALDGREGHANYAPCSLEGLRAKGYDYWALGHVHGHEVVCERPPVVFPGKLQGRHIRETGPGGAVQVEVADGTVRALDFIELDTVRWGRIEVDVGDLENIDEVQAAVGSAIGDAVDTEANGRFLICRVVLVGRTLLHDALAVELPRLRDNASLDAVSKGAQGAWVERIELRTERRDHGRPDVGEHFGPPLDELVRLSGDPDFHREILGKEEFGRFLQRLPAEVRLAPEDAVLAALLARDPDFRPLLEEARRQILGRIGRETDARADS